MIWYLALIVVVAAVFSLGIPGMGAFVVRAQWRDFRNRILAVSRWSTLDPHALARQRGPYAGTYRFFGTLEAIQGEDRIWLSNGSHTVGADLRGVSVYLLPAAAAPGSPAPDAELRALPWSRVYSLPQGTPMLVGGAVFNEAGRGVFRTRDKVRPLVVIYDCRREEIVEKAIRSGRQRNEYWNQFTVPSLITGAFSLLTLAYFLLGNPDQRVAALIALAAGLGPVAPFLPPGFALYFLYRRFWKRARLMRAQRDIVLLPLRFFGTSRDVGGAPGVGDGRPVRAVLLPDLDPYAMLRGTVVPPPGGGPGGSLLLEPGLTVEIPLETKRIELTLPGRARRQQPGMAWIFGAYEERGDGLALRRPDDPMAELILIPGDPEEISRASSRAASRYALAAALVVAAGVLVNEAVLLLLLSRIIG
jgi:hypothetical protein